jgi:NAD(P)-dependent dehydrogenase (short-subunit alcohol dehydrogenase family)
MLQFEGKTALVTGAASGIGKAVAAEFARLGAEVIAADIDLDGARAAITGFAAGRAVHLDVAQEASWNAVFRDIPRLHMLVASAGISHAKPLVEMTIDEWRRVMSVNLDGAFLGLRSAIPVIQRSGGGSIVLIASASGIRAAAGAAAYSASKAGVRMLAKAAALEAKPLNIRVNSISPAGVATPMWKTMPFWKDLVAEHGSEEGAWKALGGTDPGTPPLLRMAFPEEIAKVVAFLSSDDAANITGTDLAVDAGYTA